MAFKLLFLAAVVGFTFCSGSEAANDDGSMPTVKKDSLHDGSSRKSYHILMVTMCLRGHFNPSAGYETNFISLKSVHEIESTVALFDQCRLSKRGPRDQMRF